MVWSYIFQEGLDGLELYIPRRVGWFGARYLQRGVGWFGAKYPEREGLDGL